MSVQAGCFRTEITSRDRIISEERYAEVKGLVVRSQSEINEILRKRNLVALWETLKNWSPSALVQLVTELATDDQMIVLRILPRELTDEVVESLDLPAQERLLTAMGKEELAALLNHMAPDDRTLWLGELPAHMTRQLLTHLSPEERTVAVTLLGYPERSIGRFMTPDYIAVEPTWSIEHTLAHIRKHGWDGEILTMVYLVDGQGHLIDDIHIRSLLLAPPTHTVSNLMDNQFISLKATDGQETAVAGFERERRPALLVTDSSGVLIGIVTIDDVLRVAETAATEDSQQIGGTTALRSRCVA